MEFLYHGSTARGIKTLEPRKRYTPSAGIEYEAIYATPLPAYAAAHSFPWSSDEGFDLDVVDGKVVMAVPLEHRHRLEAPVSIYKIGAGGFVHTREEETGQTWHSTRPAEVIEERVFSSVENALETLGATLRFK